MHRTSKGDWFICHVQPHDALLCNPVEQPRLRPQFVATLPAMQSLLTASAVSGPMRVQQEMIFREHGLRVHPVTLCRAAGIVKGLALSVASEKMSSLGCLLHAFVQKNPGTQIKVERDGFDALQRLFIRPGCHSHALPALLGIVHNDAFHVKTVIFNSNLCATVLLTNQRTSFCAPRQGYAHVSVDLRVSAE